MLCGPFGNSKVVLWEKDFKLAFEKRLNREEYRINCHLHTPKCIHLNSVTAHLSLKTCWKNNDFYSTCMCGNMFSSRHMWKCFT